MFFLFEKPTGPERAQVTEYYMKTRRFGTVLNISYISKGFRSMIFHSFSIHKKNMFKKKVGTLENKTFLSFCVVVTCHKPSVNSHQPSKEDPISQHPTNTKSLQSEADPFSFWVKSHQVVYFLYKSFSWTQPLFTSGDFHGQKLHPYLAVMLLGLLPQSLGTEEKAIQESGSSHENMSNKPGRYKGEG